MSDSNFSLPIDPKDAAPAGAGFVVGLLLLAGFWLLAKVMSLPTFVELSDIPMQ